jgi:hypothetical protein
MAVSGAKLPFAQTVGTPRKYRPPYLTSDVEEADEERSSFDLPKRPRLRKNTDI